MTALSRALFADAVREEPVDVVRACLLMGCEVEPDLDLETPLRTLEDLAGSVRLEDRSPHAVARSLQDALGSRAGFRGAPEDYEDVRSSLLHQVLRRGRGLPILLSVVWCEVAARLDLPAVPLGLPGHVLVCLGDPLDEHVVVDPFASGDVVDAPAGPVLLPGDLLMRVLTNIRVLASKQPRSLESARTRLWATELSLLLPRHPLALRREHGELMVRLGDYAGGATELEDYAALVEDVDEQSADASRREARLARARLN